MRTRDGIEQIPGHEKISRIRVGDFLKGGGMLCGRPDLAGAANQQTAAMIVPVAQFVGE